MVRAQYTVAITSYQACHRQDRKTRHIRDNMQAYLHLSTTQTILQNKETIFSVQRYDNYCELEHYMAPDHNMGYVHGCPHACDNKLFMIYNNIDVCMSRNSVSRLIDNKNQNNEELDYDTCKDTKHQGS